MLRRRCLRARLGIHRGPRNPHRRESTQIVSTLLLTDRQRNLSTHPPDTGDRQILTIPDETARQHLAFSDRLTLRFGLWLLERSLRRAGAADDALRDRASHRERMALRAELIRESQSHALAAYSLNTWLR